MLEEREVWLAARESTGLELVALNVLAGLDMPRDGS